MLWLVPPDPKNPGHGLFCKVLDCDRKTGLAHIECWEHPDCAVVIIANLRYIQVGTSVIRMIRNGSTRITGSSQ